MEACDDFEGYIGRTMLGGHLRIQANGKQLVEHQGRHLGRGVGNAPSTSSCPAAFIRDAGCNGQLFQISSRGFDFLKTLGKTPVGYIAELGGCRPSRSDRALSAAAVYDRRWLR